MSDFCLIRTIGNGTVHLSQQKNVQLKLNTQLFGSKITQTKRYHARVFEGLFTLLKDRIY